MLIHWQGNRKEGEQGKMGKGQTARHDGSRWNQSDK